MALYLWIAIGSALGGAARYWCSGFVATLTGPDGQLLVGTTARQFVMVGICGGFTTFSSFSLQTLTLARDGEWLRAGANIGWSVLLCLLAVLLGHFAAAGLNQMKGA